jgi:two-component system CheB/CheR fusion protein
LKANKDITLSNEFRIITDQGIRWIHERGRNIFDDAGNLLEMIGIAIDITDKKLFEESLQNTIKQKNAVLAIVGHELMTPLAVMQSIVRIAKRRKGEDNSWLIDELEDRISGLSQLCRDLLDVSLINEGQLVLHKEPIDLRVLIEKALRQNQIIFEDKHHSFTIIVSAKEHTLLADPTRMMQILSNLISNACKYTQVGGKIEIKLEKDNSNLTVSISDNGQGIESEFIEKIYDFYFQAKKSLKNKESGIGIGLGIVKGLVEAHRGTIHASSEGVGLGTTFKVSFPIESDPT